MERSPAPYPPEFWAEAVPGPARRLACHRRENRLLRKTQAAAASSLLSFGMKQ